MKKQLIFSFILLLINIICYAQTIDTTLKKFVEYSNHQKIYWNNFHRGHHTDAFIDGKKIDLLDPSIIAINNKHGYFMKINYGYPIYNKGGRLALYCEYSKKIICGKINVFRKNIGMAEKSCGTSLLLFYCLNDSIVKKINNDSLLILLKDNSASLKYVHRAIRSNTINKICKYIVFISFPNFLIGLALKSPYYAGISYGVFIIDFIPMMTALIAERHYQKKAIKIYNMTK